MKTLYCFFFVIQLLLSIIVSPRLSAQDRLLKEKSRDIFNEIESGLLGVRFFNALTAAPIQGATVRIEKNAEIISDYEGKIQFKAPFTNGILRVVFSHPQYITSEFDIEIIAGTLFFNRFSVSPTLPIGSLRVVVDWIEIPADLDSHLIKINDYHISFRNMKVSKDGTAILDRDDVDGYGPETITVSNIDKNSEYLFYVHDYTSRNIQSSPYLSQSKATIKVYGDDRLLEIFTVPEHSNGNYWEVFRISGEKILKSSTLSNTVD